MFILTSIDIDLVYVIAWVVVFFIAVLIEALEPQLVSLWFAGGALVALLAATIFSADLPMQIVLFLLTSILLLVLTRPIVRRVMMNTKTLTNIDALIGKEILVEKSFSDKDSGMGMYGDVRWKLVTKSSIPFVAGEFAVIDAVDGNKLVVTKKEGTL
jgi:membrane protein implicated in regulation of membrane protease activity